MGAANRESTAAAVAALMDLIKPTLLGRRRAGSEKVGDQLLAAARAIAGSPQLGAVLSDFGIDGKQKTALVRKVFAGPLDKRTVQLLESISASRWSGADDLVAGIEHVGLRALSATSDAPIDTELFTLQRAVTSAPEVELALGNSVAPPAARLALVDRLLVNASPATQSIGRHIALLPRGRRIVEALQDAERTVAEARDRLVAVAHTAVPLTAEQLEALEARLAERYGHTITVNQVIDERVIGGLRITVGDDVIDSTIRTRLDDLRQRLAG